MRILLSLFALLALCLPASANPPLRVRTVTACDCAPPALFSAPVYAPPALRLEFAAPVVQRVYVPQLVQQVVVDDYCAPAAFRVQRFAAVERFEAFHQPLAFRSFAVRQSFYQQPLAFSSGYSSSLRLGVGGFGHGGGLFARQRLGLGGGLFGGGGIRASVRIGGGGFGY